MAIISSLMKTEMTTVKPGDSVADAARLMSQNQVGAVLVVDGGAMKGILSERDVVSRVVAEGKDPTATLVSEVATADVVDVDVGTHVRKCAEMQLAMGLSSRDFLAYVVEGLERIIDKLDYEETLGEGVDPYDHLGGSYGK